MRRASLAALASLACACAWTRFEDVIRETPVEFLDRPAWIPTGFGATLAADPTRDELLAGGHPALAGAALLNLASATNETRPACEDASRCRLLATPVTVSDRAGGQSCFVYGVGIGHPDLGPAGVVGAVGGCATGQLFKLVLPDSFREILDARVFKASGILSFPGLLSAASAGPALALGSPDASGVAYYPGPDTTAPLLLAPPADADGSFGSALALVGPDVASQELAISTPRQGKIYFYNSLGSTPVLRACVRRASPYGAVMLGLAERGRRFLIVSDAAGLVEVLDLDKLPASPDCVDTPKDAVVTTLRCIETDDVSGCTDGAFGYSLAAADLDSDGSHSEVIVGAPGLNVRDTANAGALAVFSLDPPNAAPSLLYLSSAESNERLGTAVAAARRDGHVVIATSALNKTKLPVFHCPLPSSSSPRCQ